MGRLSISICLVALALPPVAVKAADLPPTSDPQARGLAVATESDSRDRGWSDAKADMKMVLTNAGGETSERALQFMMLERPEDGAGNWSLMTFDRPRDIEGTALLTHSSLKDADDQWLYLPAVKRVKRISSSNKAGTFVGSEFAFEDFSTQQVEKFSYKWLKDEPCGTLTCYVIERTPTYEASGYTREIVWIDATDFQFRKIDYYDRKDTLIKTLTLSDYKLYESKFWRPMTLDMVNHESGKATKLVWTEYNFSSGLKKTDFTPAALERAR